MAPIATRTALIIIGRMLLEKRGKYETEVAILQGESISRERERLEENVSLPVRGHMTVRVFNQPRETIPVK